MIPRINDPYERHLFAEALRLALITFFFGLAGGLFIAGMPDLWVVTPLMIVVILAFGGKAITSRIGSPEST